MTDLDRALETCLELMERDELTLQQCLDQYPEFASQLRLLLLAARQLSEADAIRPDRLARARMKARLSQHMEAHPKSARSFSLRRFFLGERLRFALAALMAVMISLTVLTWAAQAAVPGDIFYPYKRATERISLALFGQPVEGGIWLAERRMEEWIKLRQEPALVDRAESGYHQALTELGDLASPQNAERLRQALASQEASLMELGLSAPQLQSLQERLQQDLVPPGDEALNQEPTVNPSLDPQLELQLTEQGEIEELVPTLLDSDTLP